MNEQFKILDGGRCHGRRGRGVVVDEDGALFKDVFEGIMVTL